jgi:hypothetical protein
MSGIKFGCEGGCALVTTRHVCWHIEFVGVGGVQYGAPRYASTIPILPIRDPLMSGGHPQMIRMTIAAGMAKEIPNLSRKQQYMQN